MQKLKEKTPKQHDQNAVYFSPVRLVSHLKMNQLRSLYSQNFKTRRRKEKARDYPNRCTKKFDKIQLPITLKTLRNKRKLL